MIISRLGLATGLLAALSATALGLPTALAAAPAHPAAEPPKPGHVLRSRTVDLDLADYRWLCADQPFGTPRRHTFRPFSDTSLEVVESGVERDPAGGAVKWSGEVVKVDGHPVAPGVQRRVVLSTTGVCDPGATPDTVGVDALFDLGARAYRIAQPRNEPGRLLITEEDPDLHVKPRQDDADPQYENPDPAVIAEARRQLMTRAASAEPVVIDMVVGYTPRAEWGMGGEEAMLARIAFAETSINHAFADSNIKASVDIVATYKANYYAPADQETAPVVHGLLSNPREPRLGAPAAALREQYGADLVSLMIQVPDGTSSGQGNLPQPPSEKTDDQAYSVVDYRTVALWYNFGHEVGHNLGLWHDRTTLDEQARGADYRPYLTTPYSTGYVTPDRRYHTLMAYSSACGGPCTAVNQYSNTENTWDGQPLGDAYNNNAAVARITTPLIAGYRAPAQLRERHALTLGEGLRPDTWGPYRPGTSIKVTGTPPRGYRISAWELDGQRYAITANQVNVTMDRAHELKAVFVRI
ncbi:M12 family metallo-peptidase [Streptomyces sp. NPDC058401]|uniref:M12 family metallo-peptidase n=1 Tax=Streptomyces sp. NPDC058401 TaxID=3346480 RepID=UPI003653AE1D